MPRRFQSSEAFRGARFKRRRPYVGRTFYEVPKYYTHYSAIDKTVKVLCKLYLAPFSSQALTAPQPQFDSSECEDGSAAPDDDSGTEASEGEGVRSTSERSESGQLEAPGEVGAGSRLASRMAGEDEEVVN